MRRCYTKELQKCHTGKSSSHPTNPSQAHPNHFSRRSSKPSLRDTVLHLFSSIKHDPANPEYRSPSGQTYTANSTETWRKPLGKKVLIVDIDTRVPTGDNQILNPAVLDFEQIGRAHV